MAESTFRAWVLRKTGDRSSFQLEKLRRDELPEGDVLIAVHWSALNYKDALAVTGKGDIARRFPLVPGIDLAGVVLESASVEFAPGDQVLINGWEIGEVYWGGYAELARVKATSLEPVPPTLGMRRAMAIGSAGFEAALAVVALEQADIECNESKPVIVTGASGGLGGIAVMLLAARGYRVTALTGRPGNADYLRALGATEILPREALEGLAGALESQRWAGAVDAVGGQILARILAQTWYGGSVAACGNTAGSELHTTVMPFILRSVNLLGINSHLCPAPRRRRAWELLTSYLQLDLLDEMTAEATLEDIPGLAEEVIAGHIRGRIVIDVRR